MNRYIFFILLFIFLSVLPGCTPLPQGYKTINVPSYYQYCEDSPGEPYKFVQEDRFVFKRDGQNIYSIQKRGYKNCRVETIENKEVTREEWEK